MKGVTFDVSVPRFILAKTVGRVSDAAFYGGISGVKLAELPEPSLPGSGWVKIDVKMAGICGTDIGNLRYSASPAMEPFGSFPAVLGHEILGVVREVGSGVTRVAPGQRVAVDPMISCTTRGYGVGEGCSSCESGLHSTCERAGDEGPLQLDGAGFRPGLTIGYHGNLPGGWGETVVAHQSQVFPVDPAIGENEGALMEPLSIAMHAVLTTPPTEGDDVLVIGSGTIALATIWALRAIGFGGTIISQAKRPHEQELARKMGATEIVTPGGEARQALVDTGASAYMPVVGDEVYAGGGFPVIYDCVGNASSLKQALYYASPRSRLVMIGCVAEIPKLDLTFVWARELRIRGSVGYGIEDFRGERRHTFNVTNQLLAESTAPVGDLVTHVFPLVQYRDALNAAANHRKSGAVKVILQPNPDD
jgi:L-iditol 2-dehydrogenase